MVVIVGIFGKSMMHFLALVHLHVCRCFGEIFHNCGISFTASCWITLWMDLLILEKPSLRNFIVTEGYMKVLFYVDCGSS